MVASRASNLAVLLAMQFHATMAAMTVQVMLRVLATLVLVTLVLATRHTWGNVLAPPLAPNCTASACLAQSKTTTQHFGCLSSRRRLSAQWAQCLPR